MQKDSFLPSIAPERWPWLVLIVGGFGVLVRAIGTPQLIFIGPSGWLAIPWGMFTLSVLGQAAFDFATVLALFYVVRILVERVWLRRPVDISPTNTPDQGKEETG